MKHLRHCILLVIIIACSAFGYGQTTNQIPISTAQAAPSGEIDDGKIYKESEVDVRAKFTLKDQLLKNLDEAVARCPVKKAKDRTVIKLKFVLSRSGKVTNVKVLKDASNCEWAEALSKDVQAIRFEPAIKDGHPVSVYRELEIKEKAKF